MLINTADKNEIEPCSFIGKNLSVIVKLPLCEKNTHAGATLAKLSSYGTIDMLFCVELVQRCDTHIRLY